MSAARPPLVVVTGATASGKSTLALELADRLEGEIVTADSQQVYRGLDVGTAKPGPAERARVPHHLIDIADLDTQLTAADFADAADRAIASIHARGRTALVVGGTGLWIRALLEGLAAAPARDPAVRAALEDEAERLGAPALHARLAEVDPTTAARLHENDAVRIVRALEVVTVGGRPLGEIHRAHRRAMPRYPARVLALAVPRDALRARIEERARAMLAAGWIDETRTLLDAGVSKVRLRKVLGYAEVVRHLEGELPAEDLPGRIATRTWHYARRQGVWVRGQMANVEWLTPPVDTLALAESLRAWLAMDRGGPSLLG